MTFIVSALALSTAARGEFPASCYSSEELEKVRDWEKTWAGEKITAAELDKVREFLPDSLYNILKDTGRWGQSWFTVVPYQQILPTPGAIEATKKYAGKAKVTAQQDITGWTAGIPFPETRDALQMAHNLRYRNNGDSRTSVEQGFIVDGRLHYDLKLAIHNNLCFFSGRVDMPPVPELPGNSRGIWRTFHMTQTEPAEVRNMRILELHYKENLKPYDSWIWMPTIRRMRRRSTSERQDAQGGSDFCGYDNEGWDGPVSINSYRLLGQKDLLLARHQSYEPLEHTYGTCLWSGVQRERIKAYVLEVTNQDPNFLYSKMTWYLDPETWQLLFSDRFDRSGQLWKVLEQFGCLTPGYNGVQVNYFAGAQMIDVQCTHGTLATGRYQTGVPLPDTMFTTGYLQKHGY